MSSENSSEEIPVTEQENPRTRGLSGLPTAEVLRLMNEEDAGVAAAVGRVLADVARAVDAIAERLRGGGYMQTSYGASWLPDESRLYPRSVRETFRI